MYPKGKVELRRCAHCGEIMLQRRFPSGRWESPCMYARRTYCSRSCASLHAPRISRHDHSDCVDCGVTDEPLSKDRCPRCYQRAMAARRRA